MLFLPLLLFIISLYIFTEDRLAVFYSAAGESIRRPFGIHSASKHARISARNEFILCSYYWSLQIKCCCNRVFIGFLVSLAFSNSQVARFNSKVRISSFQIYFLPQGHRS